MKFLQKLYSEIYRIKMKYKGITVSCGNMLGSESAAFLFYKEAF